MIANASNAGAVYALLVFICVFLLGTVRVLELVAPRGETAGMLVHCTNLDLADLPPVKPKPIALGCRLQPIRDHQEHVRHWNHPGDPSRPTIWAGFLRRVSHLE